MNPNYTKTQDINFNDSFNIPTTSKNSEIFKRMNNDEELSKIIFEKIEHVLASIQNANKFSEIQVIEIFRFIEHLLYLKYLYKIFRAF